MSLVDVRLVANGRSHGFLFVRKGDLWVLPGGKPDVEGDDETFLNRSVGEYLPEARLESIRLYDTFTRDFPSQGGTITTRVYRARIEGKIKSPSSARAQIQFFTITDALRMYPLPDNIRRALERFG